MNRPGVCFLNLQCMTGCRAWQETGSFSCLHLTCERARAHTHLFFSLSFRHKDHQLESDTDLNLHFLTLSPTYKHTELRFVLRFRVSNCVLDSLAVTQGDTLKSVDHFCLAD